MNPADQAARVAEFYQLCRVADQRDFYQRRAGEYEAANTQLTRVSTSLLVIALAAGLLGLPQWLISRTAWGIVAATLPATVTRVEEILQAETGQWGRQLTSSDAQPGDQQQIPPKEDPA